MIEDALLRELKKKAATEERTLQAVANDLLHKALMSPEEKHFTLRLPGWKAVEQPGVNILDRDKLFDLMDGR